METDDTTNETNNLIVLLHSGGSHPINNGVFVLHTRDSQRDGQQWEEQHNTEPQNNVEHHWVVFGVNGSEVVVLCLLLFGLALRPYNAVLVNKDNGKHGILAIDFVHCQVEVIDGTLKNFLGLSDGKRCVTMLSNDVLEGNTGDQSWWKFFLLS